MDAAWRILLNPHRERAGHEGRLPLASVQLVARSLRYGDVASSLFGSTVGARLGRLVGRHFSVVT